MIDCEICGAKNSVEEKQEDYEFIYKTQTIKDVLNYSYCNECKSEFASDVNNNKNLISKNRLIKDKEGLLYGSVVKDIRINNDLSVEYMAKILDVNKEVYLKIEADIRLQDNCQNNLLMCIWNNSYTTLEIIK